MITTIGALMACVLFLLGALHFYWSAGGTWGFDKSVPKNSSGEKVVNPKKIDCIAVGLSLWAFSFYFLVKVELISTYIPPWIMHHGHWVISGIFAARSIGDFKYVGFTKRIKGSDFAILDTKYFSPLCLLLAFGGVVIGVFV